MSILYKITWKYFTNQTNKVTWKQHRTAPIDRNTPKHFTKWQIHHLPIKNSDQRAEPPTSSTSSRSFLYCYERHLLTTPTPSPTRLTRVQSTRHPLPLPLPLPLLNATYFSLQTFSPATPSLRHHVLRRSPITFSGQQPTSPHRTQRRVRLRVSPLSWRLHLHLWLRFSPLRYVQFTITIIIMAITIIAVTVAFLKRR